MNADLIQEAVVGSSDAWSLLLRCGSENLDAAANYQPTKTKLTKNDYCKKETTETLSEDEAKAALKPGEFVDLNRSASYVVNASRLNKKLPNVLAVDFFYKFKRYTFFSKSTYEAIASLTGNAGSWLWGFDEFREELKSYYPTLFHTLRLAPKEAEKADVLVGDPHFFEAFPGKKKIALPWGVISGRQACGRGSGLLDPSFRKKLDLL